MNSIYDNGEYLKRNHDWHQSDSLWKAIQIKKIIKRNNLKLSSISEIGCGAGEILKQLQVKFKDVKFYGYEISNDAFNICKSKENEKLKFFNKDLLNENKHFDCILCIDVFEHVENYIGFLKNLHSYSKYKIFHIPLDLSVSSIIRNKLVYTRKQVGHLHYFTANTAIETLKDSGYEIIDQMYTPSFVCSSSKSWKSMIVNIPRHFLYFISPKLLSIFIGGASLMVLAKKMKI
jgi:2-polyprenyl-3-methyl-5-hydroxy-6-metoxy-1,4-benzoquinol methylase